MTASSQHVALHSTMVADSVERQQQRDTSVSTPVNVSVSSSGLRKATTPSAAADYIPLQSPSASSTSSSMSHNSSARSHPYHSGRKSQDGNMRQVTVANNSSPNPNTSTPPSAETNSSGISRRRVSGAERRSGGGGERRLLGIAAKSVLAAAAAAAASTGGSVMPKSRAKNSPSAHTNSSPSPPPPSMNTSSASPPPPQTPTSPTRVIHAGEDDLNASIHEVDPSEENHIRQITVANSSSSLSSLSNDQHNSHPDLQTLVHHHQQQQHYPQMQPSISQHHHYPAPPPQHQHMQHIASPRPPPVVTGQPIIHPAAAPGVDPRTGGIVRRIVPVVHNGIQVQVVQQQPVGVSNHNNNSIEMRQEVTMVPLPPIPMYPINGTFIIGDISSPAPPWVPRGKVYLGPVGLHEEIEDFFQWMLPTNDEHFMRLEVFERIRKVVLAEWSSAKLEIFGSFKTGLYLPTSDIDLVLSGNWEVLPLQRLKEILEAHNIAEDVKVLGKAAVPIVKVTDRKTKIKVDISFNMSNGPRMAELIKFYKKQYPALPKLTYVIKQFLLQRDLNEVYRGGISSYSLILIIISFLQLHKRFDATMTNVNLGVLLIEFMEKYGRSFRYEKVAICVKEGGSLIAKEEFAKKLPQGSTPGFLAIKDPLDETNDVGKSSYGAINVKDNFAWAFVTLTEAVKLRPPCFDIRSQPRSILKSIVDVSPEILEYRGWVREHFRVQAQTRAEAYQMANPEPIAPSRILTNIATPGPKVLPQDLPDLESDSENKEETSASNTVTSKLRSSSSPDKRPLVSLKDDDNFSGVSSTGSSGENVVMVTASNTSSDSSDQDQVITTEKVEVSPHGSVMSVSPANSEVGTTSSTANADEAKTLECISERQEDVGDQVLNSTSNKSPATTTGGSGRTRGISGSSNASVGSGKSPSTKGTYWNQAKNGVNSHRYASKTAPDRADMDDNWRSPASSSNWRSPASNAAGAKAVTTTPETNGKAKPEQTENGRRAPSNKELLTNGLGRNFDEEDEEIEGRRSRTNRPEKEDDEVIASYGDCDDDEDEDDASEEADGESEDDRSEDGEENGNSISKGRRGSTSKNQPPQRGHHRQHKDDNSYHHHNPLQRSGSGSGNNVRSKSFVKKRKKHVNGSTEVNSASAASTANGASNSSSQQKSRFLQNGESSSRQNNSYQDGSRFSTRTGQSKPNR